MKLQNTKTILKFSFLMLFVAFYLNVRAQEHLHSTQYDANNSEREKFVDFTHLKLDITIFPKEKKVSGIVEHRFKVLRKSIDSIWLDAPNIKINNILANKKNLKFTSHKKGIYIYFPISLEQYEVYTITIDYTAKPKKGIYFVGWEHDQIQDPKNMIRKQIWTQGQGINNRHWIPMYDDKNDKVYTDITISFDKNYQVLSNGDLINKKNKGNNTVWRYKLNNPHPNYLIMLAIGDYDIKKSKTKNGTNVQFWYYPEDKEKLEPTSKHTEDIISFMEDETGFEYPWNTYSQVMVQEFLYGAMENTSATIFGDFYFVDKRGFLDRNYINVNAHELVHQWFGNTITARTGSEAWLQESFATYYAKLYEAKLGGIDALKWSQFYENLSAKRVDKSSQYPIKHSSAGSSRIYQKGSSVLQMLKYVMGKEMYNSSIEFYLNKHQFNMVSTNDLKQAIIDKTGKNMDWFFDQWIERGGIPKYKVDYTVQGNLLNMNIQQTHKQSATIKLFKMPIIISVYYKDKSTFTQKYWIENEHHSIQINTKNKEIDFVLFDENNEILKHIDFQKTYNQLSGQLKKAPYMIDRYYALLELRKIPIAKKQTLLEEVYKKENFWGIRVEIVNQMRSAKNTITFLKTVLTDKNSKVRQAITNHPYSLQNQALFEQLLQDQSYVTIIKAIDKLMLYSTKVQQEKYLKNIENVMGQSQNVRIKFLEHYSTISSNEMANNHLTSLINLTSSKYEFRTRINAMNAIKRLNKLNKLGLKNLLNASFSFNRRLASPARSLVNHFAQQTQFRKMMLQSLYTESYSDRERKLLTNYLKL